MPFLIDSQGKSSPLFKNITRLGCDLTADIRVEGPEIADEHAHILKEEQRFSIALSSRGHTLMVNGKREKRIELRDGDVVDLGGVILRYAEFDIPKTERIEHSLILSAYKSIVGFSEKLLKSTELDALLTQLMDTVVELSRADKGFLILYENGEPTIQVARNINQESILKTEDQISDSILARVVREQQTVVVTDAGTDQEFKASVSVINLRLSSVLCVPLCDGGELFGLIYLGNGPSPKWFEPEIVEVVKVFASHASLLVRNAILLRALKSDNATLRQAIEVKKLNVIVGTSERMSEVFKIVRKVAPTDVPVLITGETGTGKELIAHEIHLRSNRANKPFVVLNCGAIPENLMESELFGHVRGAFTGALVTKIGHFQAAHTGTLFLDEIGELPLALQVKLLRALQEKVVTKVGDTKPEIIDTRILAATNRDLESQIQKGAFREDLFYRLNVVTLNLPPLRERGDDVAVIARYFLKRYSMEYKSKVQDFSPQATIAMKKYEWPGNIRQLENRIKKAVIMSERLYLAPEDLEIADADFAKVLPLAEAKEIWQRDYINEALAKNSGNRTKTAHELGVDPRTIFRHLERELDSDD